MREKDGDLSLYGFNGGIDTPLLKPKRDKDRDLFIYDFNGRRDTPLLKL